MNGNLKKEFGDYQTPYEFTTKIVSIVNDFISFTPTIVIEPTCGVGNFLLSARNIFKNSYLLGIDINKEYLFQAKKKLKEIVDDDFYTLKEENIFNYDYKKVENLDNILILGNPPWVTNSYLEFNEASNLPIKTNFKKLNGFEAISGTSNFDISEYIILDIFKKLENKNFSLAMLCKISVAINIMKELKKKNIGVYSCFLAKFDTKEIFNVSVDACLFFVEIKKYSDYCVDRIKLYNLENNSLIYKTDMGFINNIFFTDIFNYNIEFDGESQYEWRQGIKHDASKVMELSINSENKFINGFNEVVDIEDTLVYPLLKSSDIKKYNLNYFFRKYIIITQSKVGQSTSYIEKECPKLWQYLNSKKDIFNKRKSKIYKNSHLFSIFGVGEYSFSKYKVVISGFYKDPVFKMVKNKKEIMLDDTCYFLSFDNEEEAMMVAIILNSELTKNFLLSIVNIDSKRPYTKKILSRINLRMISKKLGYSYIKEIEKNIYNTDIITEDTYLSFKNISNEKNRLF